MPLPSHPLATTALFVLTAVMEILGCYLPYLWLRGKAGAWVLLPAALALAAFVALLALHPTASGRVYAAYGGVYVATAIGWLWLVDGVRPKAICAKSWQRAKGLASTSSTPSRWR